MGSLPLCSAGPKRGCLNMGARNPQESGRKAPLSCNATFSMLRCSYSLVAVQLLVNMTSALHKSQCCSETSAVQHSENCSATSVFACGMLQGWGLEGWGLGVADVRWSLRPVIFGVEIPRSKNDSHEKILKYNWNQIDYTKVGENRFSYSRHTNYRSCRDYNLGLCRGSACTTSIKTIRGTGAIKRASCN